VCVIINPVSRQLTHIVVDEKESPFLKRLVPLDLVTTGDTNGVALDCTMAQLSTLRPLVEFEYPQGNGLHTLFAAKNERQWPQNISQKLPVSAESERLAPEAVKIHKSNSVRATNGRIGRAVEFLVDPTTKKIVMLITVRKYWWKTIEARVPIYQVDHFESDLVLLKLNKNELLTKRTGQWQNRYI
jgi:hypothetical protein